MKKKILVSDSFSEQGLEILRNAKNCELIYKPGLSNDDLKEEIKKVDALIIRSATTVTKEVIAVAKNLQLVARAGVGTDNVDKVAATEAGIIVMNAPSGNSVSTAELAMALLFSLARKTPQANISMKNGKWEKKKFGGIQLAGKTMGIIGLGRIGRELAKRCSALQMTVLGSDPFLPEDQFESIGATKADNKTIFKNADFISVHVPLTDSTANLISKKELNMMKPTTMLINCARGGIYDEQAVADAVKDGTIGGAAFDVFPQEPPKDSPFLEVDNIIMTPHLGASTEEAQTQVAIETANEVLDFFNKGEIKNSINIPPLDKKLLKEMQSHITLSEKLGIFISELSQGSIKEIEITYSGELINKPVYFLTQSILKGIFKKILSDDEVNFVNTPVIAKSRGISVSEIKKKLEDEFAEVISVKITTEKETNEIWGTVYGDNEMKFVYYNGFSFDLNPTGNVLVVHNQDVPGVVGKIGTIIGNAQINISSMKLGSQSKGNAVLTLINIKEEIPNTVLNEIRAIDTVNDATTVSFT